MATLVIRNYPLNKAVCLAGKVQNLSILSLPGLTVHFCVDLCTCVCVCVVVSLHFLDPL